MATNTSPVDESNVLPRIDSQAIILILYVRITYRDICRIAHIECVRIMPQRALRGRRLLARSVIDVDGIQSYCLAVPDAEDVHRDVDDVEPLDKRICELETEEFGLLSSAVATLSVPVGFAVSVNLASWRADDFDVGAGNGDERFVAAAGGGREGCCALEYDLVA